MSRQIDMTWGSNSSNGYPQELLKNIRPDDDVVAFIRIQSSDVGCLKKKPKKGSAVNTYFLAITRERVVGTAETKSDGVKTGLFSKASNLGSVTFNIPLVKITSIETSGQTSQEKGCLSKKNHAKYKLTINAQGDEITIYTGVDSSVNDEFVRSFLEISDYF